ncbi:MAG: hypothetical protein JWR05_3501 [Mucilaginibacter sp.]|nr:hypothetical protein [Mucilaginibacter sp.]
MNKLELKHLAPYLPYGLKIYTIDDDGKAVIQTIKNIAFTKIIGQYNIETNEGWDIGYDDFKLLLLPLAELTTIQNNSKSHLSVICHKFFGFGIDHVQEPEFNVVQENGFYGYQSNNQHISFVKEETCYGISTYFVFYQKNDGLWIAQKVTDQLEMFQYLFEHFFDVFGLIDAGLAINKLDLPHNFTT